MLSSGNVSFYRDKAEPERTGDAPHMKRDLSNKQFRLNFISALILLIGLGSALVIYIAAPAEPDGSLGYEIVGGRMYPAVPDKMYDRNRELYGGKWSVVGDDFTRWFNGLWEGRSLAGTIAFLAVLSAGLIFFFNNYVTFDEETGTD
jgi:hypothetical protein